MALDSERVKWAEEAGLKNLQEKFTTADNINKEAQTTLTYVLAGMGSTFAYVLPALEHQLTLPVFGAAAMCLYFTVLGIVLVCRTFFLGAFPSPYQEPKNLMKDEGVALEDVRHGEVLNIQARIERAKIWNARKARTINVVRGALVASPLVFVVIALIYAKFH